MLSYTCFPSVRICCFGEAFIQMGTCIIGRWLDLMNIDVWNPSEEILGAKALSNVLEEFVLQHATNANPPTLFLVLCDLAVELTKDSFTNFDKGDIYTF